ncbi:MAG: phosphomannose isomerase [bacterium P3]|nr:MAG: phosphomannose isomerase [bacterium P3]KWW41094.1 MAG: phosphomannose isomerase [bacterium F083]
MKFLPLFKHKVWGGNRIQALGFNYSPLPNCGELWALSSVAGSESVVSNGFLADNTLNEVLEIYMGELVGERNYLRFGNNFPLLVKLIDAADKLSIQVHPDDELARRRGMENGKTEMWYILEADADATLVDGFRQDLDRDVYCQALESGRLESLLHVEHPQQGDVYFIPAGRVHALGGGLLLAEIQQNSDCTYRIYDYNRPDRDGRLRELHTEEALDAIEFSAVRDGRTPYTYSDNATARLVQCPHFTASLIPLCSTAANPTASLRKNFARLDSFIIYFCVEGVAAVRALDTVCPLHAGECVLVPAVADEVELYAEGAAKLLEVYIDPAQYGDEELRHKDDMDWVARFMDDGLQDEELFDGGDGRHRHE